MKKGAHSLCFPGLEGDVGTSETVAYIVHARLACVDSRPASQFKDIGKACSDLLSKDFKVGKTTVEVETKTSSGITFTPLATKSGDSVDGELKAKYGLSDGIEAECTVTTKGGASLSLEAANLMKGLVVTAECDKGKSGLSSANLIAEYKSELFSLDSITYTNDTGMPIPARLCNQEGVIDAGRIQTSGTAFNAIGQSAV